MSRTTGAWVLHMGSFRCGKTVAGGFSGLSILVYEHGGEKWQNLSRILRGGTPSKPDRSLLNGCAGVPPPEVALGWPMGLIAVGGD